MQIYLALYSLIAQLHWQTFYKLLSLVIVETSLGNISHSCLINGKPTVNAIKYFLTKSNKSWTSSQIPSILLYQGTLKYYAPCQTAPKTFKCNSIFISLLFRCFLDTLCNYASIGWFTFVLPGVFTGTVCQLRSSFSLEDSAIVSRLVFKTSHHHDCFFTLWKKRELKVLAHLTSQKQSRRCSEAEVDRKEEAILVKKKRYGYS